MSGSRGTFWDEDNNQDETSIVWPVTPNLILQIRNYATYRKAEHSLVSRSQVLVDSTPSARPGDCKPFTYSD